ncbi:hypothetical protein ACFVT2_34700 [Streptomyces sp. NPDC058000]|uniref:hypothetical protein n=1 Tax=Streptomyces sp. NPDC058000 TaxID=3346299 RepID=UPI0036E3C870
MHGLVRRYHRNDGTWSKGWEALLDGGTGFVREPATGAAAWTDRSSFLWRSRDLAAGGIAHRPDFRAPNLLGPPARRRRPRNHRAALPGPGSGSARR